MSETNGVIPADVLAWVETAAPESVGEIDRRIDDLTVAIRRLRVIRELVAGKESVADRMARLLANHPGGLHQADIVDRLRTSHPHVNHIVKSKRHRDRFERVGGLVRLANRPATVPVAESNGADE